MTKIFVFRHGQSTYNKQNILTGWHDPDLTEEGIAECKHVAEQLKNVKPTKAYTSDLIRAQHTLYIVLGQDSNHIPVIIDPRLKERNYGSINGLNKNAVKQQYPDKYPLWHRSYDVPPPGGESIKDVEQRVVSFLNEVLPSVKKEDVVFISAHGNSLRPIRRYFERISIEEMCSFEHTPAKVWEYQI